jgi:flagellar biosynthesis protein FlhG
MWVLPLRDGAGRPRDGSLSVLVNQARDAAEGEGVHDRINAVSRRFLGRSLPLLGTVRADERAALAVRERRPVRVAYPRARASRDLDGVALALASCLGISGVRAAAR